MSSHSTSEANDSDDTHPDEEIGTPDQARDIIGIERT